MDGICLLNLKNKLGQTPLMLAAQNNFQILKRCIDHGGADFTIEDAKGDIALHYAISAKGKRRAKILLQQTSLNELKENQWDRRVKIKLLTLNGGHDTWSTPVSFSCYCQKNNISISFIGRDQGGELMIWLYIKRGQNKNKLFDLIFDFGFKNGNSKRSGEEYSYSIGQSTQEQFDFLSWYEWGGYPKKLWVAC